MPTLANPKGFCLMKVIPRLNQLQEKAERGVKRQLGHSVVLFSSQFAFVTSNHFPSVAISKVFQPFNFIWSLINYLCNLNRQIAQNSFTELHWNINWQTTVIHWINYIQDMNCNTVNKHFSSTNMIVHKFCFFKTGMSGQLKSNYWIKANVK